MVPPGEYQVAMFRVQDGALSLEDEPQKLTCSPLHLAGISSADQGTLQAFNKKVAVLSRAISAADAHRAGLSEALPFLEAAVLSVSVLEESWLAELSAIEDELEEIDEQLTGDSLLVRYEGQGRMSLKDKTDLIIGALWSTTSRSDRNLRAGV